MSKGPYKRKHLPELSAGELTDWELSPIEVSDYLRLLDLKSGELCLGKGVTIPSKPSYLQVKLFVNTDRDVSINAEGWTGKKGDDEFIQVSKANLYVKVIPGEIKRKADKKFCFLTGRSLELYMNYYVELEYRLTKRFGPLSTEPTGNYKCLVKYYMQLMTSETQTFINDKTTSI